jgi:hypothetical protein
MIKLIEGLFLRLSLMVTFVGFGLLLFSFVCLFCGYSY